MWNTILFDLDGTLTDSAEGITKSAAYALEKGFGIHVEDPSALRGFVGQPLQETFQDYAKLDEEQAAEALRLFRERYVPVGIYENRPYEGIPELLAELKSRGFRLAVASSKPQPMCETVLSHFGLRPFFEVVAGCDLAEKKAHKEVILGEALQRLGMQDRRSEVVLVGDTVYDVEGAKKAGIESIAVSYGYGTREDLENAWPACIVDSVAELRNVLVGQANGGFAIPGETVGRADWRLQAKPQADTPSWADVPPNYVPAYPVTQPWPYAPNGNAQYPSGNAQYPNGNVPYPNAQYPNGNAQPPYGTAWPYAPNGNAQVPYGNAWEYARAGQMQPLTSMEEEKPGRMGYRKSRDHHPFLAFWRVIWPPLAAFLIMELVGILAAVFLTFVVGASQGSAFDARSIERLIYTYTPQITIAADGIAFILVFFLFWADERKRKALRWTDRILKKPNNWLIGLFVAVLAGALACIFGNWLLAIFDVSSMDPAYEEMERQIMTYSDPALMVFGTVLVAPIFEDIGIFHGNLVQFLYATLLGIIFAILYEHYGTILVPILAHLGANMMSEFFNYIASDLWSSEAAVIPTILISGILLIALLLFVTRKKARVNKL